MNSVVNTTFTQFAVTESGETPNLFSSIGIDWKLLILQTIAFLILFWFLRKYVYPPLVAMLDKRDEEQAAAHNAAKKAAADAVKTEESIATMLKEARDEAKQIVVTAKQEADSMVAAAEEKSRTNAEHIIASAQEEISQQVFAAKKTLHNETIDLVMAATRKVVGETVDARLDKTTVESAIKEAR